MSEHSSTAGTEKPAKRLWRLHWLSCLVTLLTLGAMIVIVVPVDVARMSFTTQRTGNSPQMMREYRCGWPYHYATVVRGFGGPGRPAISNAINPSPARVRWLEGNAWPLGVDEYEWSTTGLLADFSFLLGVPLVAATACEVWIRRRGNRLRLTIANLLVVMTVVAGCFGWMAWHRHWQHREIKAVAQLQRTNALYSHPSALFGPFHYTGSFNPYHSNWETNGSELYRNGVRREHYAPGWIVRLVGSEAMLPYCQHVTGVIVDPAQASDADWEAIASLPFLNQIRLTDNLSDSDFDHVRQMTHLRSIALDEKRVGALAYPRIPSIDREKDLSRLAALDHVESVELSIKGVTGELLNQLLTMPRLRQIKIQALYVTAEQRTELEAFRDAHPELDIEVRF